MRIDNIASCIICVLVATIVGSETVAADVVDEISLLRSKKADVSKRDEVAYATSLESFKDGKPLARINFKYVAKWLDSQKSGDGSAIEVTPRLLSITRQDGGLPRDVPIEPCVMTIDQSQPKFKFSKNGGIPSTMRTGENTELQIKAMSILVAVLDLTLDRTEPPPSLRAEPGKATVRVSSPASEIPLSFGKVYRDGKGFSLDMIGPETDSIDSSADLLRSLGQKKIPYFTGHCSFDSVSGVLTHLKLSQESQSEGSSYRVDLVVDEIGQESPH